MDSELAQLEQRVEHFLDLWQRVAAENRTLNERAVLLEAENRRLADRIAAATQRLEALMEQLPQ